MSKQSETQDTTERVCVGIIRKKYVLTVYFYNNINKNNNNKILLNTK